MFFRIELTRAVQLLMYRMSVEELAAMCTYLNMEKEDARAR